MSNEAIILAGGFGTRLKSLVDNVPKPMAPINGKPFLYYLLNYLQSEGIQKVILSVGYKHEIILNYFGTKFNSVEITYAIEDQPLGTGGGIQLALSKCSGNLVFIINGDTFFPVSLSKIKEKHIQTQAETTIALKKVELSDRYGTVSLGEDSFIQSFKEKNESSESLINGGVYLLDKRKFENRIFNKVFSFEKDYLEQVTQQHCIAGCVFNNYFLDIGIPKSFMQAQNDFKQYETPQ